MEQSISQSNNYYVASLMRHLGLFAVLAISVAVGVSVVLWAQEDEFVVLYANVDGVDAAEITEALAKMNINYKIQSGTGLVLVSSELEQEAKIQLAALGLPQSNSRGFELLDKKQPFGVSQFMETARYRRALEGELARTISSMNVVRSTRVHLAIPKQPVFIRDRRESTASVFLDLYSGRTLEKYQIEAIVNMVASSVPEMRSAGVTVIDQKGNLLSNLEGKDSIAASTKQLDIKNKIENEYNQRIRSILGPILGSHRLRSQVSTEIDFTTEEKTSEEFSPNSRLVRSAQIIEERNNSGRGTEGIPGELTDNPPVEGEEIINKEPEFLRSTHNYELDKTISHVRAQAWDLTRLSVAVAIDDKTTVDDKGNVTREPVPADELERLKELVKNAVGFNMARGDSIEIINVAFMVPEAVEALPEPAIWTQPWFIKAIKYAAAGIVILLLIFKVLKPIVKNVTAPALPSREMMALNDSSGGSHSEGGQSLEATTEADKVTMARLHNSAVKLPELNSDYLALIGSVRTMVKEDPARVSGVIMDWVGDSEDGE